jgi:diguanylate cyclase (GGDEF)-like protein
MMIDIDHFKRVNDRHGHAAGDAVLVAFADLVRESVRKLDGVYRLGGEEFLVLLPGVTEDGLGKVATTLRTVVASRLATPDGTLTASLGTSMLRPGDTAATWLSRVDEALYRAKASGRDRVCSDREPAPEHGASRAQEGSRVATSSA